MNTEQELLDQIDALLAINAKGNATPRIPGLAVELLTRSAEALRRRSSDEQKEGIEKSIRAVIDHFELWKCGEDADGYNLAADRLAEVLAKHTPTTMYYFDENGKPVRVETQVKSEAT